MSAIWGKILYKQEIPAALSQKMEAAYGAPYQIDKIQSVIQENAYMGCGIQWITEESKQEALPILDKVHHILFTADCFLDNRDELLQELSPDDNLIPDGTLMYLGYLKWGIDCLPHFLGSFSMAVYHFDTQTLYLASDHTSSRCLYYYQDEQGITFSTLLKPILTVHPEIRKNELYLKDFLIAPAMVPTVTTHDTPFKNVFKLSMAEYFIGNQTQSHSHFYWKISQESKINFSHLSSAFDYGAAFRTLYEKCIVSTLRSSEQIGIALSSGLDSSSIAAFSALSLQQRNQLLYSYTYTPYETFPTKNKNLIPDESQAVLDLIKMYPNILPHFYNNSGKNCFDSLEEELNILEIPFKAFGNLPSLLEIFQHAAEDGCRIVLTGQCGNSSVSYGEIHHILFDAYDKHHYIDFLKTCSQYSHKIHYSQKKVFLSLLKKFSQEKRKYHLPVTSYSLCNPFIDESILKDYPLEERFHQGNFDLSYISIANQNYFQRTNFHPSMFTYIGESETKLGLRYGILLRDPTRDARILSFCYHLPYRYFAYQGTPRWLIRENLKDLLPISFTCNFQRYGIQNADWLIRLKRDWDSILPKLENVIAHSSYQKYFKSELINEFLKSYSSKSKDSKETAMNIKYVIFLYIQALFCL